MLSLAKLHREDESRLKVHALLAGFVNYLKKLNIFEHILPKKVDNVGNGKNVKISATEPKGLFPTKIVMDDQKLSKSTAVPCSTHGHESLVKVENPDGSISWKFNHDLESRQPSSHGGNFSNMTSPFMTANSNTFSPMNTMKFMPADSPSPLMMNNLKKHHHHESDLESPTHSVGSDLPNPEFFDLVSKNHGEYDDDEEEEEDSGSDKGKKTYTCEFCGAEFRIRGYLTRHVKKHAITKAYECPFYEEHSEMKCHPTGGFSRRDTYKTHLKARHFKYPSGTRSQDRASTSGKCGTCNKHYESNEEWVEKHIESGECEGLPQGYTARVKNSRRKNYEYPNPGGVQISPVSSHSNDSPLTSGESPAVPHQQLNSQDSIRLSDELNASKKQLMDGVTGLRFNHQPFINDYDNNDEFSLDVEQSISFRPIMNQNFYH